MSWPCWMVQCGWSILDGSRTVRVFTQLIDFKRSSLLERPSQTRPEMFYQLSGHSLAQSSWHIKFTIHCKVLVTAALTHKIHHPLQGPCHSCKVPFSISANTFTGSSDWDVDIFGDHHLAGHSPMSCLRSAHCLSIFRGNRGAGSNKCGACWG
jgi:hypothetical protein